MGNLYAGTSGYAYKEWKGSFYPEGTKDKEMLYHYSRLLPSVEINYTFRRMPSDSALEGWKTQSAEGFRITLKAPQRITHIKRLKDVGEDVDEFVRKARTLGDRLGTILFQLPPNARFDAERLKGFLDVLPPVCKYAMEFRHDSWRDSQALELLRTSAVALCGADTAEAPLDAIPVTAPHVYLRLRREEYSPEEISEWAKRIAGVLEGENDVYCYFKHEGGGIGPAYAQALLAAVK